MLIHHAVFFLLLSSELSTKATGDRSSTKGQLTSCAILWTSDWTRHEQLAMSVQSARSSLGALSTFAFVVAVISTHNTNDTRVLQNYLQQYLRVNSTTRLNAGIADKRRSEMLHSGTPARCQPAKKQLYSGEMYLLDSNEMSLRSSEIRAAFEDATEFGRLANQRNMSTRSDLSITHSLASNTRFVADVLLLPYGVRLVLYLDTDTCVRRSVRHLFTVADYKNDDSLVAASTAALVVAKRDKKSMSSSTWGAETSDGPFVTAAQHALILKRWGFNASKDQFNNGMFLLNLEEWCELALFERMRDVAEFHATNSSLFQKIGGFNQVFMEIAVAGHARFVSERYNCRVVVKYRKEHPCYIEHFPNGILKNNLPCHNPSYLSASSNSATPSKTRQAHTTLPLKASSATQSRQQHKSHKGWIQVATISKKTTGV